MKQKRKKRPEFNNGFITAIALFLEHKHADYGLRAKLDKYGKNEFSDLRLYGGSDHLFDLEIPKGIPIVLRKRIKRAIKRVFKLRLSHSKDWLIADRIFKEFEDILVKIDELVLRTSKVHIKYR